MSDRAERSEKAERDEKSERSERPDSKSQSKTDSKTRSDKTSKKSTREGSDKSSKKTTKETNKESKKKTSKRDDKTKDQGRSRNRDSKVEIRAISPRGEVDVTDASAPSKDKNYYLVKSINQYTKLRNTGLVVVKYSTKWCGPCKSFAPIFEEIASRYPDTIFLEVDAESVEHEDCDVRTVPAFKIILNGSVRRSFAGASEAQKESIERYVTRYSSDNYSISITFDDDSKRNFTEEDIQRVLEYMKSNPA